MDKSRVYFRVKIISMTKRIGLFLLILGLAPAALMAQKGQIKGKVLEFISDDNKAPIPFANVFIQGTTTGTTTDFDGNYSLLVSPGKYNVIVSFVGLLPDTSVVEVRDNMTSPHEVVLFKNSQVLKEFKVVAKQDRASENFLLMEQKEAATITQSIGAKELSEKGASDVAEGLTKVTGISKSSNKSLFMRGLGDRYNNALLNGLPIPSPNPDLKVIPLDIFPTAVVSNLAIDKTFTPDLFGDFAGGTVTITTKDYPEERIFQVSLGSSFNTITTFRPFQRAQGGTLDALGYDDGTRRLPSEIESQRIYNAQGDAQEIPFEAPLSNKTITAMPPVSVSVLAGNYYKLQNDREFGYLLSIGHSNGYQFREGDYVVPDNTGTRPLRWYEFDKFNYTTNSSVLGTAYYRLNDRQSFKINTLFVHDSDDEVAEYEGVVPDWDRGTYLYTIRNTYRENFLFSNQLLGTHKLDENNTYVLKWGASYSMANNIEPDRKQLLYKATDASRSSYVIEGLNASDNHRFFSDLNETESAARVDFDYNFKKKTNEEGKETILGKLSFGAQAKYKFRDFTWRQLNMNVDALETQQRQNGTTVELRNPEEYYNEENHELGLYYYREQIDPSRTYQMDIPVISGFATFQYALSPQLQVIAGLRSEWSSQNITYKKLGDLFAGPFRTIQYDTLVFLPSLNLKYQLNEKSNLRFAASQTLSRPGLKELAPFQYQDVFGGNLNEGNPNLKNGINYNVDLKYEIFPNQGELFTFTVFGKYLDDPIERAQIPSSGVLYSYFNMGSAYVAGAELEYKKNLGRLLGNNPQKEEEKKLVDRIDIGFNASYLYSEITLGQGGSLETDKGTILATNTSRQMYGASPYLINADVSYNFKLKEIESAWTLSFNTFGKRIYAAGTLGAGDVYELPINTLNLVVRNKINERLNINVSAKNLLNPLVRIEQEFPISDSKLMLSEFRYGQTISFSLTYTLAKGDKKEAKKAE